MSRVELTADCEECHLEGGVVEVYDARVPACRFGLPAETSCKLCGVATRATFDAPPARPMDEIPSNRCPGCEAELLPIAIDERCCPLCGARASLEPVRGAAEVADAAVLETQLASWAQRDGFPSSEALVRATFVGTKEEILRALKAKQRVEVLADPFANLGVRTSQGMSAATPSENVNVNVQTTKHVNDRAAVARENPNPNPHPNPNPIVHGDPPPRSAPPRAIIYPLVSVIAADGEIHPSERALLDRFLRSEGLAPLADDEFRVHHPSEVAHLVPKERREDVVKLMCESAAVDGMPDESERRVIRAYATAWHVDDEKVEFWMWGYETMNTSLVRQLWLKIRRFVLSARWSEKDTLC